MTKIEKFQKELEPIKVSFLELLNKYSVENGVSMEIKNGKIRAFIHWDEINKGTVVDKSLHPL